METPVSKSPLFPSPHRKVRAFFCIFFKFAHSVVESGDIAAFEHREV